MISSSAIAAKQSFSNHLPLDAPRLQPFDGDDVCPIRVRGDWAAVGLFAGVLQPVFDLERRK